MTVLDYSNWRPSSPQQLKNAGVEGVVRYIAPASWGWPKAITASELAGLEAAGLGVAFNFEAGTSDYTGGTSKGSQQGQQAAQAMHELGLTNDVPVYLSVDTDVPQSNFGLALSYIKAFHQACGHVPGLYGEGALIEFAAGAGFCRYGWESESKAFPGNSSPTPHTVLVQQYGQQVPGLPGAYDVNQPLAADWGQRHAPAPVVVEKVRQQLSPPLTMLPWVAVWKNPDGSVKAAVADNGDVYAFGVPYRQWPTKATDFAGRHAATIGQAPGLPDGRYVITATSGEKYVP